MTEFTFRLGEGEAVIERKPAVKCVPVRSLSDDEIKALLNRLPSLDEEADDRLDFALPTETLPAPRPGRIVEKPFPSKDEIIPVRETESGPLTVPRYSPEGPVPFAPHLSVTFSRPMIPLSGQDDMSKSVPVLLEPQPPGQWRWLGTKTIQFQPDGRFHMSTKYQVEIPEGTASFDGERLTVKTSWSFTTSTVKMKYGFPDKTRNRRDSVIFVSFDQDIDSRKLIDSISLTVKGKSWPVRAVSAEEINNDQDVKHLVKNAQPGRWIAFRSLKDLPYDAEVTVILKKGAPSAEGPLTSEEDQSFSFRTFGKFKIEDYECYYRKKCPPLTPWYIRFSNPIDEDAFDPSFIEIRPEIPGVRYEIAHDRLIIKGRTAGRTKYKIKVKTSLIDVFGQNFHGDDTIKIKVGSAEPMLTGAADGFVTIDPSGPRSYSIYSINYSRLRVRMFRVGAEHWNKFSRFRQEYRRDKEDPPGYLVVDEIVHVNAEPDVLAESVIDLTPVLHDGLGSVMLYVEPDLGLVEGVKTDRDYVPRVKVWIQSTEIGLEAFSDRKNLLAWINSLKDGTPLSGIKVKLFPNGPEGETDENGLCLLTLPKMQKNAPSILIAESGRDTALLRRNRYYYGSEGWSEDAVRDSLAWYVVDDRRMYRPGETVKVKGWIRKIGEGPLGDLGAPEPPVRLVQYRLVDARDNELTRGRVKVNVLSGFDLSLDLPENMNLGTTWLNLEAAGLHGRLFGTDYSHSFQVQEFRRPEFEVNVTADAGPHVIGGRADLEVKASYYAGAGLPNAEVEWTATAGDGDFTPPGWSEYSFGKWTPWWDVFSYGKASSDVQHSYRARTDGAGVHRLRLDFDSMEPARPRSVTVQASVMDVNRQAWTSSRTLLVHPSNAYVGLKTDRTFVQAGEPLELKVVSVDLDGNVAPGRTVLLKAVRREYRWKKGEYRAEDADEYTGEVKTGDEPVSFRFLFDKGGEYYISASVEDDAGRKNESGMMSWVAGDSMISAQEATREKAMLIPDSREYPPGDTAEILVQAPFYPAEGLVSYRRSGLMHTESFRMDGPSYTLKIPVEEEHVPNVHLQVDLVGAAKRLNKDGEPDDSLPGRPAFAMGELNLKVPPRTRTLAVQVTPEKTGLEPGGETVLDLLVADSSGSPVPGAEVAVAVVDEAVLALTGCRWPDPIFIFYPERGSGVFDYHSREDILLVRPEMIEAPGQEDALFEDYSLSSLDDGTGVFAVRAMMPDMPLAAAVEAGEPVEDAAPPPIQVRMDFSALAVFCPEISTDDEGRARVEVKLPDNLTRYRVMAAAVAGGKSFGLGESVITARLPMMVRPSPPRFLNFGDEFEFPVVVQNQLEEALTVRIAMRTANLVLKDGAGLEAVIPPQDRVEVRFPAGTEDAGTARFEIAAAADGWTDAARGSLPVWTPATTEASAVYGEIDDGAEAQPIALPENAFHDFGGLEISAASTALGALTDAFLYLVNYWFDCSEQIASRILSIAALKDVLAAFKARDLPSKSSLARIVHRDIKRLKGMQNYDGGFPIWRQGEKSWPYFAIHCAHALGRARDKGYSVPEDMWNKCLQYLRKIRSHTPGFYSPEARDALEAYALYVRTLMGESDPKAARGIIDNAGLDNLHPETAGRLLYVLSGDDDSGDQVKKIYRFLANRVSETAGAANFIESYTDGEHVLLHSDRRTDGVILEALIKDRPDYDLIPRLVQGLLGHRRNGRWASTQENVFILLALERYFRTYESATPDFAAQIWLGDRFAGESRFKGRSADQHMIRVPMTAVRESGASRVLINKEGQGRLYYRLGMDYAPKNLDLEPADYGFSIERAYEAQDDPSDVVKTENGWKVRAGARVKVNLSMTAPSRRYHVALTDPLPAGFEILNPALAVAGKRPNENEELTFDMPFHYWWIYGPWYEHQNLRDHRAEAFTSLLWEGVHEYSYIARATTPGAFVVPPAKAEEMYSPETFGRSGTDRVVVVDRME